MITRGKWSMVLNKKMIIWRQVLAIAVFDAFVGRTPRDGDMKPWKPKSVKVYIPNALKCWEM